MSSKEKILQVALDQFYHNGYQASSVDDIIELAGVSKSNFYYHFRTKEDLVLTVLNFRSEQLQQGLRCTLLNADKNPVERLHSFMQMMKTSQEESIRQCGCPFGNLVAEMAEHSEKIRCTLSRMFGDLTHYVADVISEGQSLGMFRSDVSATDMAALIVNSLQGMLLMTKCHKSVESLAKGVTTLINLIETDDVRNENARQQFLV